MREPEGVGGHCTSEGLYPGMMVSPDLDTCYVVTDRQPFSDGLIDLTVVVLQDPQTAREAVYRDTWRLPRHSQHSGVHLDDEPTRKTILANALGAIGQPMGEALKETIGDPSSGTIVYEKEVGVWNLRRGDRYVIGGHLQTIEYIHETGAAPIIFASRPSHPTRPVHAGLITEFVSKGSL